MHRPYAQRPEIGHIQRAADHVRAAGIAVAGMGQGEHIVGSRVDVHRPRARNLVGIVARKFQFQLGAVRQAHLLLADGLRVFQPQRTRIDLRVARMIACRAGQRQRAAAVFGQRAGIDQFGDGDIARILESKRRKVIDRPQRQPAARAAGVDS